MHCPGKETAVCILYLMKLKKMQRMRAEPKVVGKVKGKTEGIIETGPDFGLSEDEIIQRLQNKLSLSLQKAQEYFEMFG